MHNLLISLESNSDFSHTLVPSERVMLVRKQAKTVIFLNLLYYKKSFDNDKENITLLIFYLQQQYKNNNNE